MAVLLVDPDDPALNIRAAISAAASGDMILLDPNDTYNLVGVIDDDRIGPGMAIGPDQIGRTSNPDFINQANEVVAFNRQLTDPEGNNYKASPSSGRTVAAPPSRRAAGSPGRSETGDSHRQPALRPAQQPLELSGGPQIGPK
jgi:hypothetical protein